MARSAIWALALCALAPCACSFSRHATQPSPLGTAASSAQLLALLDTPGPIELTTVVAADWAVDRGGLINLSHPRAKAAGLRDGEEPVQIYFHALRHPQHGLFIVDTGVEKALRDEPKKAALRGVVASFMKTRNLRFREVLSEWLAKQGTPLAGVLLTHLHLDHVSGMPDVPHGTPIYAGPGETTPRAFLYMFVRGSIARAMAGQAPLREWRFAADPEGRFAGLVDVFGDGSLWALHVPGHTPGSTAYLVRTPTGPVLLVGDACHTAWGWDHDVEPGSFSYDVPRSIESLARLRKFVAEHPKIEVRLGHQPYPAAKQP